MSQSQYMQGSTGQRNEIINEALGIHEGGKQIGILRFRTNRLQVS
jgi:hypothetical protein